jgi:subtilisin-like proprotein convertase family protein
MKKSNPPRRILFYAAALTLLLCGVFLARHSMTNPEGGASAPVSRKDATGSAKDNPAPTAAAREREEATLTYTSEHSGENLRIAMDRFMACDNEGDGEIMALNPPATPANLKKRLAEYEAPRGIFPVASDANNPSGEYVVITSEIRAKIPRELAGRFARENGLTIHAMPEYAPDWVVFSAADPFEAMEKISSIRSEPAVGEADILVGRRLVPMALPNDPLIGNQWHLKRSGAAVAGTDMNVEDAWNYAGGAGAGSRGRGVFIGILDDSMQVSHPDFVGNVDTTIDFDFLGNDGNPSPVLSSDNHGTAVGGVAASRGNNALGSSGVAPEATLVGMRMLGDLTTDLVIADAFDHQKDVIQVKNNSWGPNLPFAKMDPLESAALKKAATEGRGGKGTIFTFAAGNDGDVEDSANYSEYTSSIYTIAVGATSSKGTRTFYSEPGANLVISAPSGNVPGHPLDDGGLGITTADRTGNDGYVPGDYNNRFNGTSSSCPAVSGGIAVMLEKNPNLGWRDVQAILINSAVKFNPTDPGWLTNAAGLHFNNDYGAGLMDVTAAVNLAATWENLGPQTSVVSTKSNVGLSIPDNNSAGRDVLFNLPGSNIITEHVTVRLSVSHTARGDLEITLFSPSGTASRLTEVRADNDDNYSNFTFSTVQNWGENSSGVWTLKVADRKSAANTNGGTITNAELTVYGVFAPPVNPPPDVRIAAPTGGSVFSPGVGYTVLVEATDVDIDKNPDTVAKVDLYENGVLVATDLTAPYEFPRNPANGFYNYVAKATDSESLEGESSAVFVVVKNQTPVIASATLNAGNQAFDDLPLTVTAVNASDPESEPITFSYNWEFSVDDKTFASSGLTGATLAPDPNHSGKLWRCVITATDGNTTSTPFTTGAVNLLDRPSTLPVRPGGAYSYQSGLVLKGDTLLINRQAVIHEFSQGPPGGTSEWIEILTLKDGSLSDWSIADSFGNTLKFASGAWDNIPAGTLIVVYNGGPTKDRLLPADSFDTSTGAVVVSSSDEDFFTPTSAWPTLDNAEDAIFLSNSAGLQIHAVSYGNSIAASPNVGSVRSGEAAYFAGQSDAGANLAGEWLRTTSSASRTSSFSVAPSAIFPGAVFTNGQYRQDFDVEPGALGTFFPTGWSAYSVNIGLTQTTNFDDLLLPSAASSAGGVFNFGSRIGMLASTQTLTKRFDPGFIALALDNTRNLTGLEISYDIIKATEQPRSMEMTLQYATGNPDNTGTVWTSVAGTTHISGNSPKGTLTRFTNVPLPAIFQNRESPIYLRWLYRTTLNNSSSGAPDALTIDNVIISTDSSPNIFMTLAVDPSIIAETDGENASVGTITLSEPLSVNLTLAISSSDTGEVTVPASVVIPAGDVTATFPISAFDDIFADGSQYPTITVSAPGFLNVSQVITVTDNEPAQIGVTPALPNNISNAAFVSRIREDKITEPSTFRLSDSSVLPDGLTLDTATGLISGTVSPTAALGSYTVVIERRNVVDGFTSQTIVIVVSQTVFLSYSQWISGFDVADKSVTGDSENDFLPNLVEYALGSNPGHIDNPSPVIAGNEGDSISITYTKSKNVAEVTLVAEWSPSLESDSWLTDGVVHQVMIDGVDSQTIKSTVTIDPAHAAKFMRLRAILPPPPE